MKRLFALIMVLALCLSLCSCGNKGSGLTLDALEQTIKESDDDAELTVTEETDGSTFQYEGSVLFCTLTMTGTVDKKQNVTQFRVEARNIAFLPGRPHNSGARSCRRKKIPRSAPS